MKQTKLLVSIAFFSFVLGNVYSCNLKSNHKESIAINTQYLADEPKEQYVKIALLLDTSNSMDGLINQAKAQLWDIVNEFTHAKCGNVQSNMSGWFLQDTTRTIGYSPSSSRG